MHVVLLFPLTSTLYKRLKPKYETVSKVSNADSAKIILAIILDILFWIMILLIALCLLIPIIIIAIITFLILWILLLIVMILLGIIYAALNIVTLGLINIPLFCCLFICGLPCAILESA
jgi:hypothetical protein